MLRLVSRRCSASVAFVAALALGLATLAAPTVAEAQAEAAPPGYVPPGGFSTPERTEPSPLRWHVTLDARIPIVLGDAPDGVPRVGWGAGVQVTRALVDFGRMRFGLGLDFAYQRLQHDKKSDLPFVPNQQFLSHMTFAGLLVLDGIFGRWRPWGAAGAGVSVAQYEDPPTADGQTLVRQQSVVPVVQFVAGVSVGLARNVDLGLATEFDLTFSTATVGTPARTPFAPGLFSPRVELGFRF